ncbi:molybdopterin biosynthesis protein [uncultured Tateyamaria sp.]|uniref:molybdopterin biosynthesis protein n=1 Tax=uncultured Tateyamaria sp. TaxID=455651 RepID=UPI00260A98BE|nr:molybdopterin biosynthesis protein [uncultured Tateyamaria sp.]
MIFGPVPVQEAVGAVLAHSMQAAARPHENQLPYRIAKGTVLSQEMIEDIVAWDAPTELTVARLEAGDVEENAAAAALAAAIVTDAEAQNIRISGAGAGRVNLHATCAGVVEVDAAAVAALNAVDPMITLATVPGWHRTDADGMIATIKIISYGVSQVVLTEACARAAQALKVRPPVYASATLIETQVSRETPSKKGREATFGRLHRFGMMLSDRVVVRHDIAALSAAIAQAPGEVILILTASATSDSHDVAPEGLRAAGGQVTAFGMPVDPGNLLFFGHLGDKPVIGLPGCARSPALNGADWVLERLICGVPLGQDDISAMGVGGLLKEIPTRPRPRAT